MDTMFHGIWLHSHTERESDMHTHTHTHTHMHAHTVIISIMTYKHTHSVLFYVHPWHACKPLPFLALFELSQKEQYD